MSDYDLYAGNPHVEADDMDSFIKEYCEGEFSEIVGKHPKEKRVFEIDWADVFQWEPDVADGVRQNPEPYARAFEKSINHINTTQTDLETIEVRFRNVGDPVTVIDVLKGDHVGQVVTLRAQVEKVTEVQPRLTEASVRCKSCGTTFKAYYPEHGEMGVDKCQATDCRSTRLEPVYESSEREYHQLARVTVLSETAQSEASIDVHLTKDAAGGVTSGERVDITGVIKDYFEEFSDPTPEFYMTDVTVEHHQSDYETIDTDRHKAAFEAIASGEEGNPYDLLEKSIAPTLKADDHMSKIKLAIGLGLFGGWRRPYGDGRYARGDPHIALMGDPQTGKSSLLNAAESLSPRSSFVSGKNASKAGLTAAAVRDDFGDSEWNLEAGAIVKAHKGIACIDEIDKVDPDAMSSLHTALEKQRLEVSKAGIDAKLPCETTLLAAGNPEHGKFTRQDDVLSQLNIPPALRSRFDLIFILTSYPDSEKDKTLAKHMSTIRRESGLANRSGSEDEMDHGEPEIDPNVLRAYIAYARQHVKPVIEDEGLHDYIAEQYDDLRGSDNGKMGVGPRNVDAIHRLAEASARVRLSETVTKNDIDRGIMLIRQSLQDLEVIDEHGEISVDFATVETGFSDKDREEYSTIKGIIKTMCDDGFADCAEVIEIAEQSKQIDKDESGIKAEIRNMIDNNVAITDPTNARFDLENAEVRLL